MTSTFSTGLIFYYWKYFKPKDDNDDAKEQQQEWYNINDYSGYNRNDLYISSGKYKNLKEEAINSGYCPLKMFKEKVLLKAYEYIKTTTVKNIKAKYDKFGCQASHYGIERGSPILLQHLKSLILYTDFSKISTDFSSTFRPAYFGETLLLIKTIKRNS